ncbi:MAG: phosphoribosylglycinamide formyltransferase [Candidatus Sumerlaeaceae bacterium]|nr:phosphoribosylglycinamide formyltransferase [Candidatus Sumerlaeaceae bacterium]
MESADEIIPVGVMLSGRGSNFEALLRKQCDGYFQRARIVCVVSDNPDARGLVTAKANGIPAYAIAPHAHPGKAAYENAVLQILLQHGVSLVVLAGYMRIVGRVLLDHFPGRILNIHPSLLPSFPGLHAQRQAIEHGVRFSGCTVHFVDAGMDTGPIIGQRVVPVLPDDTEDTLSERILAQEHELYAECLKRVTEEPYEIRGRTVCFGPQRRGDRA